MDGCDARNIPLFSDSPVSLRFREPISNPNPSYMRRNIEMISRERFMQALPLIAGAVACLFAALLFKRSPVLAIASIGGLVYFSIRAVKQMWRDPYDLGALREIHEAIELEDVESEEILDADNVLCPHCRAVYPSFLPACPECGRTAHA